MVQFEGMRVTVCPGTAMKMIPHGRMRHIWTCQKAAAAVHFPTLIVPGGRVAARERTAYQEYERVGKWSFLRKRQAERVPWGVT